MLQMVKRLLPAIAAVAVCSCNQFQIKGLLVPTGEVVEKRFEQSAEMNKDLKAATVNAESEYMFYVATDPHTNETSINLSRFNDILRNDENTAFAVILGDCIEVKDNFPKYLEALSYSPDRHALNPDIFHILGNHDAYFNGWQGFMEQIGPSVYWFEVMYPGGKDLFISLDTATGTLGRSQNKWFRKFLEEKRKEYRHCIILTHTNFFYTDNSQTGSGNMPIEESFSLIDFLGKQNVSLVLQGHDHYWEDLTYHNVRYCVLGTIRDESDSPEYLKVNVTQENIHLDRMQLQ